MIDLSISDLMGGEPVETDQDRADQAFEAKWPGISKVEIAEKLRAHAKKSERSGSKHSSQIAADLRVFADRYEQRAAQEKQHGSSPDAPERRD